MNTTLRNLGCTAALATALAPASAAVPEVKYQFTLSDFGGGLPLLGVRVHVDRETGETFVLDDATVRIFNKSGMQTFTFGIAPEFGRPVDVAVEPSGDILVATNGPKGFSIVRLDYRGVPKGTVAPLLPGELAGFGPNTMEMGPDGLLYLLSGPGYRVVVLRTDGGFVRDIDLAKVLAVKDEDRARMSIGGMGFDGLGNLLVTITERFLAYVVAPDGTVRDFGTAGSAPGRFGVVGAITGDSAGNIFVADRQRSVVLVFDRNLEFLTEFGGYGNLPESLIRPEAICVAGDGRVLVGQMAHRGVSVFRLGFPSEGSPEGQEVGGAP